MKRPLFFVIFVGFFAPYATLALSCTDITKNVTRYQENTNVQKLQSFLYEKGYLKATPNGYFGLGTLSAVKAYQKAIGVSQTGVAGAFTRASIKKETCDMVSGVASTTSLLPKKETTTQAIASSIKITETPSKITSKNETRWNDSETILRALGRFFTDSRGVLSVSATATTPIELCVTPKITQMASPTEVAVVATPVSPCLSYVDIAHLLPSYLTSIPRDPTLATSSALTGYMILRNQYNDVTLSPKVTDNKEIIKVRCNFDLGCKNIQRISAVEYGVPFIETLNYTTLLKDATPKTNLILRGKHFSDINTVFFQSKTSQRIYEVGTFASSNATGVEIPASSVSVSLSCGVGCREKLPVGDYSVFIKNQGGTSNLAYLRVKAFTTSTISSHGDTTVRASSTAIKIGTISISASLPTTLTSLTLRSTSTSAQLPAKLINFKLKDQIAGTTIAGSGLSFGLSSVSLLENHSRFYDVYTDVGNVLTHEAGFITYGGTFLIKDTLSGVEFEFPIKEFSFSVSP
ncbi:MAG: putative peptidoglycan binding domain [Candidatus Parcubacteria bacterium]|jgi:peptidoglycan hydrolase-like protein with peptidoglycan-binding domain